MCVGKHSRDSPQEPDGEKHAEYLTPSSCQVGHSRCGVGDWARCRFGCRGRVISLSRGPGRKPRGERVQAQGRGRREDSARFVIYCVQGPIAMARVAAAVVFCSRSARESPEARICRNPIEYAYSYILVRLLRGSGFVCSSSSPTRTPHHKHYEHAF